MLPDGKKLLDNISFTLKGSSLLTIISPSSASKSTILKMLSGFPPTTETATKTSKICATTSNVVRQSDQVALARQTLNNEVAEQARQ